MHVSEKQEKSSFHSSRHLFQEMSYFMLVCNEIIFKKLMEVQMCDLLYVGRYETDLTSPLSL